MLIKPKSNHNQNIDYEQLGRKLVSVYESGYLSKGQLYKASFLKGIFAGMGGVIGATIFVALILWLLSLFHHIPLIGPFVNAIKSSIQYRRY